MTQRYRDLMFTPTVREAQAAQGSKAGARRGEPDAPPDRLGEDEAAFLATRDSFYIASVSENGWPYLQHRGGAPGFVRVLSETEFGIADLAGNRQYVSLGNLAHDDRVALFFMDYPRKARLKVMARARVAEDEALVARLAVPGYRGRVERGLVFAVEAFDWNCPQHIAQRFTLAELRALQEASA